MGRRVQTFGQPPNTTTRLNTTSQSRSVRISEPQQSNNDDPLSHSFTHSLTHLNGLRLEGLLLVREKVERDPVELTLVDVRDTVILPPLTRRDGRLQVVAETAVEEPAHDNVHHLFTILISPHKK